MTKKRKNYNDKAPYLVKKTRKSNDRPMCSICKKCLNKDFCNHRRDLKLMNKCTDCHNCSDNEHCDKFYISEQYSITINVGVDEETGEPIRKKFLKIRLFCSAKCSAMNFCTLKNVQKCSAK